MAGDENLVKTVNVMTATSMLISALGEAYPNGPDETVFESVGAFLAALSLKVNESGDGEVTPDMILNTFVEVAKEYISMGSGEAGQ